MSERTIVEQRDSLAMVILGWRFETQHHWGDDSAEAWYDDKGDFMVFADIWNPDTDLTQAMMLAEALREKGYTVRLTAWPQTEYPYNCTVWDKYGIERAATCTTLERAIFQAAVQVAERLEKERALGLEANNE